jgi:hypothetical protein
VAVYAEAASESQAFGAMLSSRLRRDDGSCAPGLSGDFRWPGERVPSGGSCMEGTVMDSERFDRLVHSFGQTRTRRQTLRGLAGVAVVGALAVGRREASARCVGAGKG